MRRWSSNSKPALTIAVGVSRAVWQPPNARGQKTRRYRGDRAQPRALGSRDGDGGAGARSRIYPAAGHDPSGVLGPPADQLSQAYGRVASLQPWSARGDGFTIVEERQPSFLLDGAVLSTGEVDRETPFETGFAGHQALPEDGWQPDPLILDDQALVLSLRDRGLVVLSGCGHAGIVNTVRYARRLTGPDKVGAIVGGFHLPGRASFHVGSSPRRRSRQAAGGLLLGRDSRSGRLVDRASPAQVG